MSWEDISGLEQTKSLLIEAVILPQLVPDFFKGKYRHAWTSVLLVGPPGTGKTMLAKAVATQCRTTFFSISPSSLTSKWRGESEKLVRLLFEMARFSAPSTIFIDEVDALSSRRGDAEEQDATRKVKTELLCQMSGLSSSNEFGQVTVIGATNRPWDLDEAQLRRFEKRVNVGLPCKTAIEKMLVDMEKTIPIEKDVDFNRISDQLLGYSGSDIMSVCREASMSPLRRATKGLSLRQIQDKAVLDQFGELLVTQVDFEDAIKRVKRTVSEEQAEKCASWANSFGSK